MPSVPQGRNEFRDLISSVHVSTGFAVLALGAAVVVWMTAAAMPQGAATA